ncbi:interleukin-11 receptor subunit alpha-like [Chiloscyllium punctatum]|uniref:interleukin-11 receptor subunit alpha-like n=1 Tax=Chiloscyllium punctatum TaxID=137246 RepID=UPI003B6368AB
MIAFISCLCHGIVLASILLTPAGAGIFGGTDVLYGRIGTDITLKCKAANNRIIQWKVNGTFVTLSNNLKEQNGSLVLLMADLSMEGNYSCHDETTRLLYLTQLKLGYPPSKPLVHCVASNFYRISCMWENSQEGSIPVRYIATYRTPSSNIFNCPRDSLNNICQIDNPQMFASLPYVINITAVNPIGHRTTLLDVMLFDIVQPDPPVNITAEPVFGSPRRIRVQWDYPLSWGSQFKLKFVLEYKLQKYNFWSRLDTKMTTEIITDAIAAQLYAIRVKTKDFFDNGKWSNWSSEVFVTPWRETTTESIQSTVTTQMMDFVQTLSQSTTPTLSPNVIPSSSDVLDRNIVILISIATSIGICIAATTFVLWIRSRRQESDKNDILTKKALTL